MPRRCLLENIHHDAGGHAVRCHVGVRVAVRARLRYKFLKPADRSEYKAMLADGQADFVIDLTDDMSQAENYGYKLTDSYLSAEFSWVLLRRHNGALNNVAVAYDFSPSALEMPGLSDTAHVGVRVAVRVDKHREHRVCVVAGDDIVFLGVGQIFSKRQQAGRGCATNS